MNVHGYYHQCARMAIQPTHTCIAMVVPQTVSVAIRVPPMPQAALGAVLRGRVHSALRHLVLPPGQSQRQRRVQRELPRGRRHAHVRLRQHGHPSMVCGSVVCAVSDCSLQVRSSAQRLCFPSAGEHHASYIVVMCTSVMPRQYATVPSNRCHARSRSVNANPHVVWPVTPHVSGCAVCAARCRSHEHPRVALVSTLDGWGGGVHEFRSDGDVKFIAMTGSARPPCVRASHACVAYPWPQSPSPLTCCGHYYPPVRVWYSRFATPPPPVRNVGDFLLVVECDRPRARVSQPFVVVAVPSFTL
jgi:hypothetical protein